MNWFIKKYNEYIENKLKQMDENETYNKKSKQTIQEELDTNKWFYPLLIILVLIAILILFFDHLEFIPIIH